jgi:hypothetical protein
MEWASLTIGGFLMGSILYVGYFTTREEPELKFGYFLLGLGIFLTVGVNIYVDFAYDISKWYKAVTLTAYTFVTAGLVDIMIQRRRHK